MEQLLAASAAARQLLEELRALSATLKSLPRLKLGEDLSESVLRIVGEKAVPVFSSSETPVVPLSKTVLRRLKNPRIWAWPVVMVVVALLLVLYNPQQKAPPLPGGPAQREVAMVNKGEEGRTAVEEAPVMQPAPPEEATMPKGAEEIKAARERSWDKEAFAAGKSADITNQPVLTKAGGAKLGDADLHDKLALKDMPKAAFKARAKGTTTNGQTAVETLGVAIEPPAEVQAGAGGTLAAEGVTEKKPLAEAEAGEPSMEKEQAIIAGAYIDQVLVVYCDVTREAIKNQAFDKLLGENRIAWSEAPADGMDGDNLRQRGIAPSLSGARAMRSTIPSKTLGRMAGKVEDIGSVEIVYIEAPAAQIQATITGLTSQSRTFQSVSITQTKDISSGLDNLNLREDRAKEAIKAVLGQQTKALQTGEKADLSAPATPQSTLPAPDNAPWGRAQRLGYYSWDYQRGVATQTEGEKKRHFADTTAHGLPEAMARSPVITDQAGKSASGLGGGSFAAKSGATVEQQQPLTAQTQKQAQSGQSEQAQSSFSMQRTFFVLRVVEGHESSEKSDAATDADPAGAKQ